MKTSRWTIEHALYGLVFGLALGVRFLRLGAAPLTDFEAGWALGALEISGRGTSSGAIALGPNPAYGMLTGLLFFLLGSSNGLARFWPALAGALLVFLPLFFRRQLGQRTALCLALGLALDPGLVFAARTAGSALPALAFGLLALGATYRRQAALAGILGGLALLSGPGLLTGAIGLGLAWGATRLLARTGAVGGSPEQPGETPAGPDPAWLRRGLSFLAGTALLAGTLFFRFPQGLGALAETLTAYLGGWGSSSGAPALRLPIALLVYHPLPLVFGCVAAARGWLGRSPQAGLARRLSLWALFGLLMPMLYPARQVEDLIWMLVPLWALAALEIADDLAVDIAAQNRPVAAGQAALLVILLAFGWNYLLVLSGANQLAGQAALRSMAILAVGVTGMGAVTTLLVSLGWTWPTAQRGLVWGVCLGLGLYMLAAGWGLWQVRPAGDQELWSRTPSAGEASLLASTLQDFSEWHTGFPRALDAVVLVDSPSLRWLLRDWPEVRYATELSPGELPSAILAYKGQEPPALTARYRGQDFAWETAPAWEGLLPADLARWLAFRQGPEQQNELILWVRADLFPGSSAEDQAELEAIPGEVDLP